MSINITVQSLNDKTIQVIDVSNFTEISSNVNNETITLNSGNYILNIHSSLNTFTIDNFWGNLTSMQQDGIIFAFIMLSVGLLLLMNFFLKYRRI